MDGLVDRDAAQGGAGVVVPPRGKYLQNARKHPPQEFCYVYSKVTVASFIIPEKFSFDKSRLSRCLLHLTRPVSVPAPSPRLDQIDKTVLHYYVSISETYECDKL